MFKFKFSFGRKEKDVIFNIDPKWKYIYDRYPIQPAAKYKHEYIKHPPPARCPGFQDLYKHGYIVPMWFDMQIAISPAERWEDQEVTINSNVTKEFVSWHYPEVATVRPTMPDNFFHSILKLHCPWQCKTKKENAIIQTPIWFQYDKNYEVIPGALNTNYHHDLIFPLFLKQTAPLNEISYINLNAGDPLVCLIPVEREEKTVELRLGDPVMQAQQAYYSQAVNLRKDSHIMYREFDDK